MPRDYLIRPTFNGENIALSSEVSGVSGDPGWVNQSGSALYPAWGSGDATYLQTGDANRLLTPTAIGTSVARCVKFALPTQLVVSNLLLQTAAAVNSFTLGIYRRSDGARVWASGSFTTVAGGYTSVPISGGTPTSLTLDADVEYYMAIGTTATGNTAAIVTPSLPANTFTFGTDNSSTLGGFGLAFPMQHQFAVTAGAMPATLPALAAASWAGSTSTTAGGMPIVFLQGTV